MCILYTTLPPLFLLYFRFWLLLHGFAVCSSACIRSHFAFIAFVFRGRFLGFLGVLLVPYEERMDTKSLKELVSTINRQEVPESDVLSDNVYMYKRKSNSVILGAVALKSVFSRIYVASKIYKILVQQPHPIYSYSDKFLFLLIHTIIRRFLGNMDIMRMAFL